MNKKELEMKYEELKADFEAALDLKKIYEGGVTKAELKTVRWVWTTLGFAVGLLIGALVL